MEKCIIIDGKKVKIKASAGVLIRYKAQFGTDYNSDVRDILAEDISDNGDHVMRVIDIGYKLLWSMAKTADKDILPPDDWIKSFDNFDIIEILMTAKSFFEESLDLDSDNADDTAEGDELTAENLLACASLSGISLELLDDMPLKMLINTLDEYCALKNGAEKATQEDFDNF